MLQLDTRYTKRPTFYITRGNLKGFYWQDQVENIFQPYLLFCFHFVKWICHLMNASPVFILLVALFGCPLLEKLCYDFMRTVTLNQIKKQQAVCHPMSRKKASPVSSALLVLSRVIF